MTLSHRFDFANFDISRLFRMLALSLIAVVVLVGAVGLTSVLRVTAIVTDLNSGSERVYAAQAVQAAVQDLVLRERDYRVHPTADTAAAAEAAIARAEAAAMTFQGILSNEAQRQDWLGIHSDFAAFKKGFARTVDATLGIETTAATASEQGPKTVKAIEDMEAFLVFVNNPDVDASHKRVLRDVLNMRISARSFLKTGDPVDRENTESFGESAGKELEAMLRKIDEQMIVDMVETARAELEAYGALIDAGAGGWSGRASEWAALDALSLKMEERLMAALMATQTEKATLTEISDRTRIMAVATLLAFLGVGVLGSLWFSRFIARETAAGIDGAVDEMQALAAGNLDIEITGAERHTEIGKMARALVVFRDNARASQALEAKQKSDADLARQREVEDQKARAEVERQAAEERETARVNTVRELADAIGAVVHAGANGDFSRRVDATFADREMNGIAEAINTLVANVEDGIAETSRVLSQLAEGDLTGRMTAERKGKFAELAENVNATVTRLSNLVDQVSSQCADVSGAASDMAGQSSELARRAEDQAKSLTETSAAIEEIAATFRSTADRSAQTTQRAEDASTRVGSAGDIVGSTVEAMEEISASSKRIAEIVSVIDNITFQTNLLALNAGVEAARAGDAGRGFAVVASEVRALAQRSSESSKDISALIDESTEAVGRGVDLVRKTGSTLEGVVTQVTEMATVMKELNETATSQTARVGEVEAGISGLDSITQKNAQLSDASSSTARDLLEKAEAMQQQLAAFRTGKTRPQSSEDGAVEAPTAQRALG